MNNKIDFYEKKKALHEEMVDAIKELLHINGLDELDLSNGCDTGYVTIVDDCLYPPTEVEVKRVFLDEHSNLMADVEFDYDNCINLEDLNNVMLCSFDTVYESVYELIHKNEVQDCKHYHLGFCHFYMGGMCNGIDDCHVKKGCYTETEYKNTDGSTECIVVRRKEEEE